MMIKTKIIRKGRIMGVLKDGTPPNSSMIDVMVGSPSKKQMRERDMGIYF